MRSEDGKPEVFKSPNGLKFIRRSQNYQLRPREGVSTALSSTPCDLLSTRSPFYRCTDQGTIISQKACIRQDKWGAEDGKWNITLYTGNATEEYWSRLEHFLWDGISYCKMRKFAYFFLNMREFYVMSRILLWTGCRKKITVLIQTFVGNIWTTGEKVMLLIRILKECVFVNVSRI